ncbi:unnamed protein product [Spirodela intermedia]|uniref:Uncharacterized protein n=1 Tax=Spirodela intermedia TaxID=51605 RepID=A0A7I8JP32_SPIIN|nr:unnamed protein product [Spirodela intermedia]CAA6671957.1 unnamed protein product [Spirodela intermedia]
MAWDWFWLVGTTAGSLPTSAASHVRRRTASDWCEVIF